MRRRIVGLDGYFIAAIASAAVELVVTLLLPLSLYADQALLKPKIVNGRIVGRGACDTKGSIAAMWTALATLAKSRNRPESTRITLAALVDGAQCVLANDTDVAHLANAIGTSSVVLFAESQVSRWAPVDRCRHTVLYPMEDVTPQQAITAVTQMLAPPLTWTAPISPPALFNQ